MGGWLTTLACALKHTGLSLVLFLAHRPQVSFSFWQPVSDLASTVFSVSSAALLVEYFISVKCTGGIASSLSV